MIKEVNAVNFRQNLGEMISQVQYRNDSVVINKSGKPVAVLVDAKLFRRIRLMWDRFDELTDRLAKDFEDAPESDMHDEILAAVRAGRKRSKT